jgi:hypothetical protein
MIIPSRHFTISLLMAAVFLVAIGIALVSSLEHNEHARDAAIITLPMISLLLLTFPRLKKANEPFLVGFQGAGWLATLMFGYLAWIAHPGFFWPASLPEKVLPGISDRINALGDSAAAMIFFAVIHLIYTTPLVLISVVSGYLSNYWSRRERRTHSQAAWPRSGFRRAG